MKILIFILTFLNPIMVTFAQPPAPVGPVPSKKQIEWYHREIMAFFHIGINTFMGADGVHEYSSAYGDYYAGLLSELLRNYGPIWEVWWDGEIL